MPTPPAVRPDAAGAIRPITPEDLPALGAVIEANDLFPAELLAGMTAPFFEGAEDGAFWLTWDDGGPRAVAYCAPERLTSGTWNLLLIAVHPDAQGRGHGTALLRHVERMLAGRGERILLVETSGTPEFARTRAFYAGRGYEEEARIRDFYDAGDDKVIFRKVLD